MEIFDASISNGSISDEDQQAIIELITELDKRWNERDAKAFADLFDADADFQFFSGAWVKSKAAIETFRKNEVFPGLAGGLKPPSIIKRVSVISQDLVIGDGTLRFVDDSSGQDLIHSEREATLIAVKKEGCWLISADRLSPIDISFTSNTQYLVNQIHKR